MVPELDKLTDVWTNPVQGLGASGMQFALTIVLTIIFIIAILYMLSAALRNERLKRWLAGELMQAFASALMIIGLVVFALFITQVFYGFYYNPVSGGFPGISCNSADSSWSATGFGIVDPANPTFIIKSPLDYFRCKFTTIDMQFSNLYADTVSLDLHVERAEWSCWIFFGTEIMCGWDLHPLAQSLHALAYKIVQYRIGVNAALVLADYVQQWFLPIFLPIGILLRAIPFTRGAGGLIIATVLGFYFIFPIVFMFGDLLLSSQLEKPDLSFIDPNANECVYSDLSGAMGVYVADAAIAAQAQLTISTIRSLLTALIMEIVLAPLLALAATVMFIRAFSPIFGSDSSMVMYGISKMI
ncbi:MAG: hypothetical protein Q7T16_01690 [Candidatus Burarchaeum sp.]|nr:hypothetical protein [Candidatus Burarchaeum sp.]MDO8339347.1 hypothetical protein [Candidatus Burarchaeum sp.]